MAKKYLINNQSSGFRRGSNSLLTGKGSRAPSMGTDNKNGTAVGSGKKTFSSGIKSKPAGKC